MICTILYMLRTYNMMCKPQNFFNIEVIMEKAIWVRSSCGSMPASLQNPFHNFPRWQSWSPGKTSIHQPTDSFTLLPFGTPVWCSKPMRLLFTESTKAIPFENQLKSQLSYCTCWLVEVEVSSYKVWNLSVIWGILLDLNLGKKHLEFLTFQVPVLQK